MIHRLEIENFCSIREPQVIDLRIGAKVPDEEQRFAQIKDGSGDRVPRTVAIFGHNASGKSNVLKALAFLRWFLVDSIQLPPGAPLPFATFASAEGLASPTRIKVYFDWFPDLTNTNLRSMADQMFTRYSYELRLFKGAGIGKEVLSEELRSHPLNGKSRRIFERRVDGKIQTEAKFSLRGFSHILDKLRPNASLTSTIAQFIEDSPVTVFLAWAQRIPSNIFLQTVDLDDESVTRYYAVNPEMVAMLNGFVNRIDLGLNSVAIRQTSDGPIVLFEHSGLAMPMTFLDESQGTKKFLKAFPILREALITGGVAILDELDSAIHPMLLPEILRWFHDPKENPHNAQLWFSGHSASLLEELQKEEIFFTEKDSQGRTKIYGLKEIESVRRSDNFYQKYLGGVYGAVPRIG